jgi:hypothetical protein
MILSEVPLKSQTLSGKIKAADDRIEKTGALVEERRAALNRAHDDHNAAIEEARDLRIERDLMAAEVAHLIGQVGEPPVAAGEEVSISADVGSGDAAPASCEHSLGFDYSGMDDCYICPDCGCQRGVDEIDLSIQAVRRVALG